MRAHFKSPNVAGVWWNPLMSSGIKRKEHQIDRFAKYIFVPSLPKSGTAYK